MDPRAAQTIRPAPGADAAPAAQTLRDEPFMIKVMRLPSPYLQPTFDAALPNALFSRPRLLCASHDQQQTTSSLAATAAAKLSGAELAASGDDGFVLTSASSSTAFGIGAELAVSSSLGAVYQGEMFRTCVCVTPTQTPRLAGALQTPPRGAGTATVVGVRLELQTEHAKTPLVDSTLHANCFPLQAGETVDYVVETRIVEANVNCLVVSIHYADGLGHEQVFRKFFKFHVAAAVDVATRAHAVAGDDTQLLVEATVTNRMPRPLFLEDVHFDAATSTAAAATATSAMASQASLVVATPLNPLPPPPPIDDDDDDVDDVDEEGKEEDAAAHLDDARLMPSQAKHTFLFTLSLRNAAARVAAELGCVRVNWRSLVGETGALSSPPVRRDTAALASQPYTLRVAKAPSAARIEQPVDVTFAVENRSPHALLLAVHLTHDAASGAALVPLGVYQRRLGVVAAGATVAATLQLLPLTLGVARLTGVRIVSETPTPTQLAAAGIVVPVTNSAASTSSTSAAVPAAYPPVDVQLTHEIIVTM
jgi:hypothetical protein